MTSSGRLSNIEVGLHHGRCHVRVTALREVPRGKIRQMRQLHSAYQAYEDLDGFYMPLSSCNVQRRGGHVVLHVGWTACFYKVAYCLDLRAPCVSLVCWDPTER